MEPREAAHHVPPVSHVILPWCSKETYAAYASIKSENIERTRKLQFNQAAEAR